MMFSWTGAIVIFQVAFTELFIAVTILTAGAHRFAWP